ncbi:DUF748 domain-containing protein [Geomesophilobacter sediminis]|uniref:DUF748 domain-containing protein n=1 Tax=Geomesophilobacter sediminis TaxID=2798584 RepID=A0A8J7SBW8_9BACT|nr:DUF748 domain-containing protein [Geomesophilobacter sediminis]MBJ6728016.1 DUF748 domain-containing protein [Geomesophilobacter sediminis]
MAEPEEKTPAPPQRPGRGTHLLRWVVGIIVGICIILFIASFFIDEPVRRVIEKKLNTHLVGYTVRLPGLHVRLIGFALTFKGLTIAQKAHPAPPIIEFPILKANVHWREIFSGKLVGELTLIRPKVHVNLAQLKTEVHSNVPVKKRGWQQALEDIYPLKINHVLIKDGDITYLDPDSKLPLRLGHVNFEADNIRNIHLPDRVYPSNFHLDTTVFDSGRGTVDGKANLLAEPVPGVKAHFKLEKVPIDRIKPIIARASLSIQGGQLGTDGAIEYGPKVNTAQIRNLVISGMTVDYIHSAATAAAENRRAAMARQAAKKLSNRPGLLLRMDQMNLTGCTFGMINRNKAAPYRIFISDTNLHLSNFSNQFSQGASTARLTGKFMGTGTTQATAAFRPEKQGPDLDLYVKIDNTQLTGMNELLHSYANFTVTGGTFSLITELHVKNNAVTGYLKPFFKDLQVRHERKGPLHRLYEMLVGGVAKLLENRPRQQVATKADISGPLKSPQTSTWQIIVELVRNAFFKAILPTFEHEARAVKR